MILKYPLELDDQTGDFITFSPHEYRTNQKNLGGNGSGGSASGPTMGPRINLFMPTSTPPVSQANGWGLDGAEGPLAQGLRGLSGAVAGTINDVSLGKGFSESIDGIVKKFTPEFQNIVKNADPALRQAGLGLIGNMTNRSASQLLALSKGLVYNPNIELLYQAPSLRGFNFSFIFVPKSEKEADIVNKIILEFKKWSSPNPKDGMFQVPAVWEIKYMVGKDKNKNMNAFKRCACTNVSYQDNSSLDTHMSYKDGMPITTTMTLTFQEVDIITREDHKNSGTHRGY